MIMPLGSFTIKSLLCSAGINVGWFSCKVPLIAALPVNRLNTAALFPALSLIINSSSGVAVGLEFCWSVPFKNTFPLSSKEITINWLFFIRNPT